MTFFPQNKKLGKNKMTWDTGNPGMTFSGKETKRYQK